MTVKKAFESLSAEKQSEWDKQQEEWKQYYKTNGIPYKESDFQLSERSKLNSIFWGISGKIQEGKPLDEREICLLEAHQAAHQHEKEDLLPRDEWQKQYERHKTRDLENVNFMDSQEGGSLG